MIKNINQKLIGNLVFKLRTNAGLNQEQLAKELGVTKAAISQWENEGGIKTEKLYEIAKFFNVTVSELINGKLDNEDDDEYYLRNYDLNNHPSFETVDENNENELIDYLEKCNNVINRLFVLFPGYMNKTLNKKQLDEFKFLASYLKINTYYLNFSELKVFESARNIYDLDNNRYDFTIYDVVSELNSTFATNRNELDYELSKIYSLRVDIEPEKALEYSEKTAALYINLLNQQQKDELLTDVIKNKQSFMFENSVIVKRLIDSGARCLFTYDGKPAGELDIDSFDELKGFEGPLVRTDDSEIIRMLSNIDGKMNVLSVGWYGTCYYWRMFSFDKYHLMVNNNRTRQIKNIIYLKGSNPMAYYEYLLTLIPREFYNPYLELRGNIEFNKEK